MKPNQLGEYRVPSDARIHPDGTRAVFVVSQMDLEEDRYVRRIWLWDGAESRPLTAGSGDSSPRWSPDGSLLAFLREAGGVGGSTQVAVLDIGGGEAEIITHFGLGVTELEWSPDGSSLAVVATEYTEDWAGLDEDERQRRPRRITELSFRHDNQGWLFDRKSHIWVVDPGGGRRPMCLTPGEFNESSIVWHPGGSTVAFLSARHEGHGLDDGTQVWEVPGAGGVANAATEVGLWAQPSYNRSGALHVLGKQDVNAYPDVYPLWRRQDDGTWVEVTGSLDRNMRALLPPLRPGGPRWLDDGSALATVEDEGAVRVARIMPDGTTSPILDGPRVITGFDPLPDGSAAVLCISEPTVPGEVWWWNGEEVRRLTHLNDDFRAFTHLVEPTRFTIEHAGATIDGWVYLPEGDASVPALLSIHGGPASQYGYGFFDEFQVYAGAGYGVVAVNPRGSSGYGSDHVRAVVGRWAEEEPPDLVDLLAALEAAAESNPRLDLDRRGIMGGSYGGLATVRVLAADQRYRSAVAERGLYTFASFSGTSDIGPWFSRGYLGTGPPEGWDVLWAASPLRVADRITTPTLVLHSAGDLRTPIEQGEQLFSLLLANGVETEFVRFPADEGHELSRSGKPRHRRERFEIILDWHERHLR